ncbi:YndJ family protein [Actinoplanes sp. CA-030573]|uniref:YndJ family protein n=1 Tax=Actinoplanes sp. CA-030573 TaxID=3239898 RepID=UPI003D8A2D69
MTAIVNVAVTVGMLLVVPLGLRLAGIRARWWPAAALPAAIALWLPRGPLTLAFTIPYALATAFLAINALPRLRRPTPVGVAVTTALVTPFVAAAALVAERYGYHLLGFRPAVLALTVAHFHFAGFAAALIAGLVAATAPPGRPSPVTLAAATTAPPGRPSPATLAALTVPAGTALVFAGYFISDYVELAGAVVLTAGMWLVAGLTWRHIVPAARDRTTRALLLTSTGVLAATMLLALSWALGEATGLPHPSLTWMAATHGLANALCFGLCGILAWRRLAGVPTSRRRTGVPAWHRRTGGVPARRTHHDPLTGRRISSGAPPSTLAAPSGPAAPAGRVPGRR